MCFVELSVIQKQHIIFKNDYENDEIKISGRKLVNKCVDATDMHSYLQNHDSNKVKKINLEIVLIHIMKSLLKAKNILTKLNMDKKEESNAQK